MTHYEVLGISEAASPQEIKQAYRSLVKQYHPDINPSDAAKTLIVKITTAYDVLSDPIKKDAYDWQLKGLYQPAPDPVVNEYELRRKEYIKRKREQEQRQWEQLFLMKVRFYKYQRLCAYPFIFISLIFSLDFFFTPEKLVVKLQEAKLNPAGYAIGKAGPFRFETDPDFFYAASSKINHYVSIHYSSIFDKPVGVSLGSEGYFSFHGTLHSFGNFFSYLLLILAIILLQHKEYSDFAMTIGILPFFITMFMLLLAL